MTRIWPHFFFIALAAAAGATRPATDLQIQERDFTLKNFHFASGETLPELRLHATTLGTLKRDAAGHATNAVMILHGTGGSGHQFLTPMFRDVLFLSGQLLDAGQYFLILPDDMGHGKSSKPSDGLHARFPHYDYSDMVTAEYRLATEGLGVDHLRLLMGTSMGCMHSWMWGETYPTAIDALMPLACLPVPIAGRNRLFRKAILDAIRHDAHHDPRAGHHRIGAGPCRSR